MTGSDDSLPNKSHSGDHNHESESNPERDDDPERERVGTTDELSDGERVVVDVAGVEVAVFKIDGEYHAVLNYCVHQGGPVCEGSLMGTLGVGDDGELNYRGNGQVVSCPWHGWEFDVTTGEHLAPTGYRLPTYEVVVEDNNLYIVL